MKLTVSKGRDCSSMVDMTPFSVTVIERHTHTHSQSSLTGALIIYQWFVAVYRNVETWKENSLMLILHLHGWADARREGERERASSLCILLSWICPRAAFHPHHRSSDGTFLPPLLLFFSLLFTRPLHFFLPFCHASFRKLSHSSFIIAELYIPFLFIFFYISVAASHLSLSLLTDLCVYQPCASNTAKLWRPHTRFKLRVPTVIVMLSRSTAWSFSSQAPLSKLDEWLEGKMEQEIQ